MLIFHRSAAIGKFLIHRANPHTGKPVMKRCLYAAVAIMILTLFSAFDLWIATFSHPEIAYAVESIIATVLLLPCFDACVTFFYLSLGHTVQLAEEKRYDSLNPATWQFVAKEDP